MDTKFQKTTWRRWLAIALGVLVAAGMLLAASAYVAVNVWPSIGAQAVDVARKVVGDQVVADFENIVLQSQDQLNQVKYGVAGAKPVAPWQADSMPAATVQGTSSTPKLTKIASLLGIPHAWTPDPVTPLGTLAGEGQWVPYIQDASGNVVAYRTFLQPDPKRPYAYVAIVAFDLQSTRLHFVLGFNEPKSTVPIARSGRIPAEDLKAGRLLAAFNGGFKAQHGHFGVMVNGITVLQPREGFGTVGIYDNGDVRIGAWGKDIKSSPHLIIWRQNGPLIIQDGQINPHTADKAPQDWGYTVYGGTTTTRSALGISADGKTLYYAVGPSLTLPSLARALQALDVYQAIQLDINNYYAHFEAIQSDAGNLKVVPLLDEMKGVGDHRFLSAYSRDFFYITTK